MSKRAVATCPECSCEFDVYDDELGFDTDSVDHAAHNLLKRYQHGYSPSVGDVSKLKGILIEALVNEFGVPRSSF